MYTMWYTNGVGLMSFYLSKKKQIYYFRIRIPKDLIPYFPIPEIKKSLKTRDPSSAKLLHSHLSNKVQKTFSILRADTLSDEEINLLVCSLIQTERKTPSQSSVSTKAPKLSNIIKLFVHEFSEPEIWIIHL